MDQPGRRTDVKRGSSAARTAWAAGGPVGAGSEVSEGRSAVRLALMLQSVALRAAIIGLSGAIAMNAVSPHALAQQQEPEDQDDDSSAQPAQGTPEEEENRQKAETAELLKRIAEQAAKSGNQFRMPGSTQPNPAQPTVKPSPGAQPAQPAVVQPTPVPSGEVKPSEIKPGEGPTPGSRPLDAPPLEGQAEAIIVPEGMVRLEFTDAVQIPVLVNWVRDTLGIQMVLMDAGLAQQTVTFTAPMTIEKDKLMPFLLDMLEQKDYTAVQNSVGIYLVQPRSALQPHIGDGEFTTTRIIQTPNIRPSTLSQVLTNLLNVNRVGGVQGSQPSFLDDLGVIIMTDTPRNLSLVQALIDKIVSERAELRFARYPLNHLSAANARDRLLELLGQTTQRFGGAQPGQPGQPAVVGAISPSTLNLSERLSVDTSSNALIFRGRDDERELVSEVISLVDVPNALVQKFYPVGLATSEAVANAGAKEQLGGSTTFESSAGRGGSFGRAGAGIQPGQPGQPFGQAQDIVGAGFVIYPESGGFIYRGTPTQHERVVQLIDQLKDLSERDRVTIEFYKLKHGKAEDVAAVIQNLLSNTAASGNRGGLLGRDLGGATRQRVNQQNRQRDAQAAGANLNQPGSEPGLGDLDGEDVFVIEDAANNQVVVKARAKLQPQFKKLINSIDLRRPQVYLDAKIVVVSSTDALDLTVEAQQIIGQFALNTNFGLGTLTSGTGDATTGGLTSRKNPVTNLTGVTAALIRSNDVPLLINALARDVDGRTIATPQLLVDDNSEAIIESIEQRPTSTTSQSGQAGSTVTGFGGFEDAGPRLTVTPQIADGGYLRLEYEVELSSFQGEATANLPPPRLRNLVRSESVTVPTDHTIVVGGLTQENSTRTILKIPLLGDIPLVGNLFKDQNFTKSTTTLYVFITPKIMRDPTFADLRLITSKPLVSLDMPSEIPPPEPVRINVIDTADADDRKREKEREKENKRRDTFQPRKGYGVFD